jgi:hypothetical protein
LEEGILCGLMDDGSAETRKCSKNDHEMPTKMGRVHRAHTEKKDMQMTHIIPSARTFTN